MNRERGDGLGREGREGSRRESDDRVENGLLILVIANMTCRMLSEFQIQLE